MTRPANPEIREKILKTAVAAVVENGHETLNMRDVASRLGITATTIYHYFRNRKNLLLEVMLLAASRLNERIDGIDRALPSGEYLARLGREYIAFAEENPRLYVLMVEDVSGELEPDEEQRRILYRTYYAAKDAITRAAEKSDGCGETSTDTSIDEALFGWIMLHGFSSLLISGRLQSAEVLNVGRLKDIFFSYYTHGKILEHGE